MTMRPRWRKSSYSGQESHCVELSRCTGQLRDSKDPGGPALRADVAVFVRAVQQGRFDR